MKVGIVGAGATGLTAAYRLAQKGCQVVVFELEAEYGGLARTLKIGPQQLECFYHHIFTSDSDLVELIAELGLANDLLWLTPKNGIYSNHKLYPFTSPIDLLLFKELKPWERVALGLLVFKARSVRDWRQLETVTAKEWILRNAGPNVYQKIWGPMLSSKFDFDAEKVSAAWLWNKFKLRGSTRGKNINQELLGYLQGSFNRIYEKLAAEVLRMGGLIKYNHPVTGIVQHRDGSLEINAGGERESFDRVIVTTAPEILAELYPQYAPGYIQKLKNLKYKANLCMILELTGSLSPYYWISIAQKEIPFVAVIEQTNLLPVSEYQSHIVYLSRYLDATDDLYSATDEEIKKVFIKNLKLIFADLQDSDIKAAHLSRARYTQPVVVKNYSQMVPEFRTPVSNLYLASMAQIYPEDRGQNYAVRMGEQIAKHILAE